MRLPLDRNKFKLNINYSVFGFLIPFIGMGLVLMFCTMALKQVYPNNVFSLLYSDCYHQYFPFFKAYRQAILSGESLLWNWDVGLGLDYVSLIAYYLGSPLNILSIFIPEEWLLQYFTLLNPIRLGFAGLFFSMFLQKVFNKNDISIALFGSFYALCAWVLGYRWNVMWVDTFALLPLVALGAVKLLQDRKFLLYTISLFLAIAINYYIGLLVCIFILLVFFCYEICRFAGWRKFFADLGLMALFSLIGIGLTAFISLPTFAALQTTYSSVSEYPENLQINFQSSREWSIEGFWDSMRQVAGNTAGGLEPNFVASEGLPNIYCGISAIVFMFLFVTSRQVKLRDKLCGLGLLLFIMASFVIRQLDYIWNGFHFTNMIPYRFSFLCSFVMLYLAYRAWVVRRHFRLWQILVAFGMAALLIMCSNQYIKLVDAPVEESIWTQVSELLDSWEWTSGNINKFGELTDQIIFPLFNSFFLIAYLVAMLVSVRLPVPDKAKRDRLKLYFKRLKFRRALSSVLLLSVMGVELVTVLIHFGCYIFPGNNAAGYPRGGENSQRIIAIMEELEKDNLFYRAEVTKTQTLNDGALNGYNGLSTFTSTANVNTTYFTQKLGFAAQNNWNRYVYRNASPVANMFLNVKYLIDREGSLYDNPYVDDIHSSENVHLLQNNIYLPLGFMTDPALAKLTYTLGAENRFEFQNELMTAAMGKQSNVWSILDKEHTQISSSKTVTLKTTNADTGRSTYSVSSGSGSIYYTYYIQEDGFFCVDLNLTKKNHFAISVDHGDGYKMAYPKSGYDSSYTIPMMIGGCQVKAGDKIQVTIKCDANVSSSVTVRAAVLNEQLMRSCHEELNQSTLQLTKFTNTLVEGYINVQEEGLLYTSIPQNGNWNVYVDGKKAETVTIGRAMVGVMLPKGGHTVSFRYENSDFVWGCVITGISAAGLGVLAYLAYYRPRKKEGKYEK